MFFAAVAMRDDPSLVGKPVAVGGCALESFASFLTGMTWCAFATVVRCMCMHLQVGGKSMISTANYEARTFGVRSAMPGFIAVRVCQPQHRHNLS